MKGSHSFCQQMEVDHLLIKGGHSSNKRPVAEKGQSSFIGRQQAKDMSVRGLCGEAGPRGPLM